MKLPVYRHFPGEDTIYTRTLWKEQVALGRTDYGYWQWVNHVQSFNKIRFPGEDE